MWSTFCWCRAKTIGNFRELNPTIDASDHPVQFGIVFYDEMRGQLYNQSFVGRGAGLFTLLLFVAYLIYVPVHLATESHCFVPEHICHADCGDRHQHHGHDGHDHDGDHQHHSADEHDIKYTGKQDSLKVSDCFLTALPVELQPDVLSHGSQITDRSDQLRSRFRELPCPSRAPPRA